MERVLEEFSKWFLNLALALAIGLIIQPLAKEKFDFGVALKTFAVIGILLAFGGTFLYLSTKVGGSKDDI